jgi:hypothetical protein
MLIKRRDCVLENKEWKDEINTPKVDHKNEVKLLQSMLEYAEKENHQKEIEAIQKRIKLLNQIMFQQTMLEDVAKQRREEWKTGKRPPDVNVED